MNNNEKGLIICGNQGCGKTTKANSILATHGRKNTKFIDGSGCPVPRIYWETNSLVLLDAVPSIPHLKKMISMATNDQLKKIIVTTQLDVKTLESDKSITKRFKIMNLTKQIN